ncbi:hypothetical protein DW322_21310 [Rhodococcus rhodnii]|uniref:Major tail protein n=2 Tax=Rhodococcus rhodnii TaxID=38312 RepID=R7WT52_9NOCA|nr:hypothetical protein [Rhodococcus rhodnii]EOM77299.1 hypothetical protein Rrhod_1361 [Rhodococcus rhodnii LMG 5362]TXG88319.1 hypothetical protein DW322_21390 [Rhodococcus rhodnii]TXG89068.1 hypothetical protein DW322_00935 [Rhodococcus rhodnii]TXG92239.1 hypothetical protein DW322_21310 [Rhodococcus rhodnii]
MADQSLIATATQRPGGKGVFYRAPLGTDVPEDSVVALPAACKDHGYVGDSGIVQSTSRDTQKKKALGGVTVKNLQNDYTQTYQVTLLESKNAETLRTVVGDDNVEVDANGYPIKVTHTKTQLPVSMFVIDTIDDEGLLHRDVIERGQITTVGDVTKVHTDTISYQITIEVFETDGHFTIELHEPPETPAGLDAPADPEPEPPTGGAGSGGGELDTDPDAAPDPDGV